jgi:tRNA uridine 5-carboxymethylaminomethyl modification enzyme
VTNQTIVVIGAGHAGCEAALAAARMGAHVRLVTMCAGAMARMSCNPSVGGIAKSHLVCELDALGGEMAVNTDYTGLQFRVLNMSRGPAVRATRVQSDSARYSLRMGRVVSRHPNIQVVESEAIGLVVSGGSLRGVELGDGSVLETSAAVLTPGTFLRGVIHIGDKSVPGGRRDEPSADRLCACLKGLGFAMRRLKTGTPARLFKDSVDFTAMECQPGLEPPPFFSWRARREAAMFHVEQPGDDLRPWPPGSRQLPCYLTHTNARTHDIIRRNLSRSSLYGGQITGTGVRYCPSVEDKVVKFPDRDSHHVFIEPEGRDSALVYPNGISNSLPSDVQEDLVRSIAGLEKARIAHYAYAIEYDFSDPVQLRHTLETKLVQGLFMAGQINGTTGYEEAAAQGFVAGCNAAAMVLGRDPLLIGREDGYIGIMIDDLVTKGTDEPYRMFTSRAERRLILRQDNARFRMLPFAARLGIADPEMMAETRQLTAAIEAELERLRSTRAHGQTLEEILRAPDMDYSRLPSGNKQLHAEVKEQVEVMVKYDGYIRAEERRSERSRELDSIQIPADFDYRTAASLRHEARERLARVRPTNLGQAARIPGLTPADISVMSVLVKRQ